MPEFQPFAAAELAGIDRPGCPNCRHHRMLLAKLEAVICGFDDATFECQKCGHVRTITVEGGTLGAQGRVAGDGTPPA